jgi:hypothetical protein
MIKSRQQLDIGNLLDLHTEPENPPLEPLLISEGPLLPDKLERPPYDEIYLKQRYDRDLWSRNG